MENSNQQMPSWFKQYGGLVKIIRNKQAPDASGPNESLNTEMDNYFHQARFNGFNLEKNSKGEIVNDFRFVRITDSFFDDTFRNSGSLLNQIIKYSRGAKTFYNIQISLLNPFSDNANKRSHALSDSRLVNERINKGLYHIKKSFDHFQIDPDNDGELNKFKNCEEYIFHQLDEIDLIVKERKYDNFELRFSSIIPCPSYIFSQYAFKGNFMRKTRSAETNFYLYEKTDYPDDYSHLVKNFLDVWEESEKLTIENIQNMFQENLNYFGEHAKKILGIRRKNDSKSEMFQ